MHHGPGRPNQGVRAQIRRGNSADARYAHLNGALFVTVIHRDSVDVPTSQDALHFLLVAGLVGDLVFQIDLEADIAKRFCLADPPRRSRRWPVSRLPTRARAFPVTYRREERNPLRWSVRRRARRSLSAKNCACPCHRESQPETTRGSSLRYGPVSLAEVVDIHLDRLIFAGQIVIHPSMRVMASTGLVVKRLTRSRAERILWRCRCAMRATPSERNG